MRTMTGGAFGFATGAAGNAAGIVLETMRFGGIETGFAEHPVTQQSAPATSVNRTLTKGFRVASKHDCR
jgi:hypothetical protein